MLIGKTSSSISKAELLSYVSEEDIIKIVLPGIKSIPCLINSPFRKDTKPSFSIYVSRENHIMYNDFATNESGSLLDLCCKVWNCSINKAMEIISQHSLCKDKVSVSKSPIRTLTHKSICHTSDLKVVIRPWHDYDYQYWASYGVERKWLHYAEIYPISYKIIIRKTNTKGKSEKYVFPADKYAYCFVERKEGNLQLKVYQPYNKKGFKWMSKMDASVIGLWSKIPLKGEKVVICSSLKDALCLSCQLLLPTLCLQGEGYGMSDTAINSLKERYSKIYVSFDTDPPGIEDGRKLCEKTGFTNVVPDLKDCKDYSDFFHKYGKEQFKQLIRYFS